MKPLFSLGLGTAALTSFAVCATQPAQAAQFFKFSYAYSGVTASGTLRTNDGNGDGSFTIDSILGQRNGIAITSLIAPASVTGDNKIDGTVNTQPSTTVSVLGGNTIDRNDNLLFPTRAVPVTFNGFSYRLAGIDNQAFNVFASNDFSDKVREFNPTQGSLPLDSGFALQVAAVPTPALLPGLIGIGIAAIRKKKAATKQP